MFLILYIEIPHYDGVVDSQLLGARLASFAFKFTSNVIIVIIIERFCCRVCDRTDVFFRYRTNAASNHGELWSNNTME